MSVISFYSARAAYGFMSNFYRAAITIDGKRYQTSEHYFQSQKFVDTAYANKVANAKNPMEAATLGRSRKFPIRADWEFIKEDVMMDALRAKFTQHKHLKNLLLETGNSALVEHTENDSYWGDGGYGNGKNRLGVLLMRLREELK